MKKLDKKELIHTTTHTKAKKAWFIVGCSVLGFFAFCFVSALLTIVGGIIFGSGVVFLIVFFTRKIGGYNNVSLDDCYILFSNVVAISEVNDEGGTYQTLYFANGKTFTLEGFRASAREGDYYYIVGSKRKEKTLAVFSRKDYELDKSLMHLLEH